jgi:hypothetical protein
MADIIIPDSRSRAGSGHQKYSKIFAADFELKISATMFNMNSIDTRKQNFSTH